MAEVVEAERLLWRIQEAAERVAVGRSTLYQEIESGALPVVRIGRSVRISDRALREWAERQEAATE